MSMERINKSERSNSGESICGSCNANSKSKTVISLHNECGDAASRVNADTVVESSASVVERQHEIESEFLKNCSKTKILKRATSVPCAGQIKCGVMSHYGMRCTPALKNGDHRVGHFLFCEF